MVLAKEMIQSKRAVTKLYASKAHMNSVSLGMKNQLGEFRNTALKSLQRWNYLKFFLVIRYVFNLFIMECLFFCSKLSVKDIYLYVFSCTACSWVPAEEHRSDESHAEPDQSARDPGHHEGAVKGDDEGWLQLPTEVNPVSVNPGFLPK